MLYQAKGGTVALGNARMEYIRFGTGPRKLVMLPGLGDGLKTVKDTALAMAWLYRCFAPDFTVYMFSRKEPLEPGCTTRDMARDLAQAMDILGITRADILGVSMGGMIAQHLAAEAPHKVASLILAVTAPGPNPILTESVEEWVRLAEAGDHAAFLDSNLRRIYSPDYYRKNKWAVPLLGALTRPKSYARFYAQARACLNHDARGVLGSIQAPTLVIGGAQDRALGEEASRELAQAVAGAVLKIYPQWGHGLYEEEPSFNTAVLEFLQKNG